MGIDGKQVSDLEWSGCYMITTITFDALQRLLVCLEQLSLHILNSDGLMEATPFSIQEAAAQLPDTEWLDFKRPGTFPIINYGSVNREYRRRPDHGLLCSERECISSLPRPEDSLHFSKSSYATTLCNCVSSIVAASSLSKLRFSWRYRSRAHLLVFDKDTS